MIELSHNELVHQALELDGNPEKVKKFYDAWAADYKTDTDHIKYAGPVVAANLLKKHLPNTSATILDAGCGTGFVGQELEKLSYNNLYGSDLSNSMAAIARETGAYQEVLYGFDMMQSAKYIEGRFDAVISVGVFTLGHVKPESLNVLVDLTLPGGIVLVSIRDLYFEQTNIEEVIEDLLDNETVSVVEQLVGNSYSIDGAADYWVFRKN